MFYREWLLAPRPTPKLEDHPLSAVHNCLLNLFAANLHKGGRFSIRNLRTRHAVVTGTHYTGTFVNTPNNPAQWHTGTCYSHMGCYNKKANRTQQLISFHIAVMVAVSDGMVDNGLHIHSEHETPV